MNTHACDEIGEDNAGFPCGRCICGWQSPPCPDEETAIDYLMQHAYEMGVLHDPTSVRAGGTS